MVRTKAEAAGVKAVGAKALRKTIITQPGGSSASSSGSDGKAKQNAGNSYCPRETPTWQKEITNFFIQSPAQEVSMEVSSPENEAQEGTSKSDLCQEPPIQTNKEVPTSPEKEAHENPSLETPSGSDS